MKNLWSNLAHVAGIAVIVMVMILVLWGAVSVFRGIGHWWHDFTTISPAEQATIDRREAEYQKSPLNPENIARKCLEANGYPKVSSWDGSVTCTDKGGSNKNVNIEVNQ